MKKRFLLLVLCIWVCMPSNALPVMGPVDMQIFNVVKGGKEHRAPALLPSVFFDGSNIDVTTPYPISQMTVLVRDANGVLLETATFQIDDNYVISLSEETKEQMYSVELIYDSRHLIGFFV